MEGAEAPVIAADLPKLDAAGFHEGDKINPFLDNVYFVLIDHLFLSSYLAGRTAYL
jgi:hypothetical protein